MLMRHPTQARRRRGVILMVVLALLTLFAIVGITFVLYADAEATGARIAREAEYLNRPDVNPEVALSMFLGQFIYGVNDLDQVGIYSGLRGHDLARGVYGYNPGGLNDKPFIGTGHIHYGSPYATQAGAGVAADDAFLMNFTYFPGDGWLRDPERYGTRSNLPNLTTAANQGLYTGGYNVPYTYPDHNNFFLGMMNASSGQIVVPSFHRDWLFGKLGPGNNNMNWLNSWGKYLTLRPRPVDQLYQADVVGAGLPWPLKPETLTPAQLATLQNLIATLQAQNRLIPYPTDNGGDVKNWDGGPGGNDSPWIDINAPVMTSPDGRRYKMLVAPLVIELDSRLNLNVHGNILATGNTHASNQGWGTTEVNPTKVITSAELISLFLGSPAITPDTTNNPPNAQPTPHVLGRYGRTGYPQGTAIASGTGARPYAGGDINGVIDAPFPNAYTFTPFTSFLFPGAGTAAQYNHFPTYITTAGYGGGVPVETTTLNGVPNHPLVYNSQFPQGDNRLIPLNDLAAQLRFGGTGSDFLTSDLFRLVPSMRTNPKARNLTTLLSADLDLPGLVPYVWNPNDTTTMPTPRYRLNGPTTSGQQPIPFPALPPGAVPAGSEFDPVTWRSVLFRLGRVDLSRTLTQYPGPPQFPATAAAYPNSGSYDQTNMGVVTQINQATSDRQRFAADIFAALQLATGALSPTVAFGYGATSPEYQATRYLAQLAVNIVDYIDQDDFITPFNWDTSRTTNDDAWVFGTEAPRLVFNEVYVQYDNVPADLLLATPKATNFYNVNIWAELLNPLISEGQQISYAYLYDTLNKTNIYQIKVADPNLFTPVATALSNMRQPENVRGDLIGTDAANNFPPTPVNGGWGGNALQQVVVPSANTYNAPNGAIAAASNAKPIQITSNNHGLATGQQVIIVGVGGNTAANSTPVNPLWTITVVDANNFTLNGSIGNAAYTNGGFWYAVGSNGAPSIPTSGFYTVGPLGSATGGGDAPTYPAVTNPNLPVLSYMPGLSYQVPVTNTTPPAPTLLLQRLAFPGLPPNLYVMGNLQNPNLPYNPYVTVDYLETRGTMTSDMRQVDAAGNVLKPAPKPAYGHRQPYAANYGLVTAQSPLVAKAGQIVNTFYQHNARESVPPAGGLKQWGNGMGQDPLQTLTVPFNWLVQLDRQVSSPMELLHVSGYKPHELTQQFAIPDLTPAPNNNPEGIRYKHMAPWTDQTTRLYRFFELAQTRSWAAGVARGGRVLGKVNINMIWDQEILRALADAQPANLFYAQGNANTDANVDLVLANLLKLRSPQGMPGAPFSVGGTPADQPFWSLSLGYAAGGDALDPASVTGINTPQPPLNPRGIQNTLLRFNGQTLLFDPFPADDATNNPMSSSTSLKPMHPYQRYQMLTKLFNNVTTRSNVFAVWLTVGFFEVMKDANGNYVGDLVRPVQLGAEIGRAENKQVRHRMFAIIDRTNLQTFSSNLILPPMVPAITVTNNQPVTQPFTLGPGALTNPNTGASWTLQADMALVFEPNTGGTISFASNAAPIQVTSNNHGLVTGQMVTITGVGGNTAANGTFTIAVVDANNFTLNGSTGTGAYVGPPGSPSGGTWCTNNEETVIVQAVPMMAGQYQATFTKSHVNGVPVINRGHPGPWLRYDPRKDPLVVPYFAVID